jgi:glucose-6-phosphate isomerase
METISMLKEALSWSGELNKFIAITANKEEAEKYKINNIIEFDKEIGGRYSIWSEISSLIHCLKKNEYDDFMAGGKQADIDLKKNTSYIKFVKALAYSDIWFHNSKNKNSRVILSYDWNLRSFTNYIQQLEMESLGKQPSIRSEFKKTGQIIFGGYGPTAQHSYFQLLHQGTQDICADIIASKKDKKSLAYAQAITQSRLMTLGDEVFNDHEKINADIPINLFLINNTSSYELGYLLATWEHRTYITAVMLGINPFDQFGVIASKIYTKKYLSDKD